MISTYRARWWLMPGFSGAVRTWALVMFVAVALEVALLYLLRPGVLRLLLPTPTDRDTMYRVLDPTRGLWLLVMPYVFGLIAGLARIGEIGGPWAVAWMLYACMLMRALVPLLVLAAVALRKLLLPAGHWIVWGALVAGAGGLACGVPVRWAEAALLAGIGSRWLWIVLALVLIPVGSLLRLACNRLAARLVGREELVEYAFPVEIETRQKPRRMLVDVFGKMFGEPPRARRFVFLVQESAGLHRPRDWAKAGLVWLVAFAGLLYALRNVGGSAAHMAVTVVSTLAFFAWCGLRRTRIVKGALVQGVKGHALPVGNLELFGIQTLVFSAIYFATGILAALGAVLIWGPGTGAVDSSAEFLPRVGIVRATAENMVQGWLVLLAFGTFMMAALTAKTLRGSPSFSWLRAIESLMQGLIIFALMMAVLVGLMPVLLEGGPGRIPILAGGWRALFVMRTQYYLLQAGDVCTHGLSAQYAAHNVAPLWHFEILAWAVPALVLAYFLAVLWRVGRGRAHASYRLPVPPALPKILTRDLAAGAAG
jgi:hypothetical protein